MRQDDLSQDGEEASFPGRDTLELQHLYRARDFLEAHEEQVEKAICFRVADLLTV